jgi:RNA polymerase sigma factor (sigma-70 family)
MTPDRNDSLKRVLDKLASEPSDEYAWTQLYERTRPFVFRVNCYVLRGADTAEDATQDVFARVAQYCTFGTFADDESFLSYLRRVCWNVSRSYLARARRRGEIPLASLQEDGCSAIAVSSHLERRIAWEQLRVVALGGLVGHDRVILGLWLDGSSIPEISEQAGITYSNVAVRLHRLHRKLRYCKVSALGGGAKIFVKKPEERQFLPV